jgi:hypothetical protein
MGDSHLKRSLLTEENISELLMIPDSEVGLRDGGLVTIAAWHDSLHPCQLHGGQSSSRKILTPVTDVTGSDDISDAYFARDFGGWDMQVPTATKIAGLRRKPASWGHLLPPWAHSFRSVVPKSGRQRRGSSRLAGFAAGSS